MGRHAVIDMLQAHRDGLLDFRAVVVWHLSTNLYPAAPEWMADGAIRAIEFVQRGEDNRAVALMHPTLGLARLQIQGKVWTAPPARLLVDALKLEAFIEPAEEV